MRARLLRLRFPRDNSLSKPEQPALCTCTHSYFDAVNLTQIRTLRGVLHCRIVENQSRAIFLHCASLGDVTTLPSTLITAAVAERSDRPSGAKYFAANGSHRRSAYLRSDVVTDELDMTA